MGYGRRALQQLVMYYQGKMPNLGDGIPTREQSMDISTEVALPH